MINQDAWETAWNILQDEWEKEIKEWDRDLAKWWNPAWMWRAPKRKHKCDGFLALSRRLIAARFPVN